MRELSPYEWSQEWSNGISIQCKCGGVFFAYGLQEETASVRTAIKPDTGTQFVGFCEKCGSAFISSENTCPRCRGTSVRG